MSESFKIAVVQLTSTDRVEANLTACLKAYRAAAEAQAQLVVFPENALYLRIRSGESVNAIELKGSEFAELAGAVNSLGVAMLMTTPLSAPGKKPTNTTVLLRPGYEPKAVYNKIHLFDVDVPGAPAVRESDHFVGGTTESVLEIDGWAFGLTICYDLRFAELFLKYAQTVDAILVPAAFLVPTGEAHWHVLLRARAIETQAYIVAPAQSGRHSSGDQMRQTYGHSLVVDPWGRIMADLGNEDGPSVHVVTLTRSDIEKVRRQIPMSAHRRLKPV